MKAIIYARVSTTEQAASGLGIDAQLTQCRAFAAYRQHDVVETFTENGCSGGMAPEKRPELRKALAMLKAGAADVLVAAKVDRLGRDVRDLLGLVATANDQGWSLAVLDIDVDTATANGRMLFSMLGVLAEWERGVIAERTSAALQAKKAAGARLGRPVELSAEARQRVRELRADGLTMRATAAQLNAEAVARPRGGQWNATAVSRAERADRLDAEAEAARKAAEAV